MSSLPPHFRCSCLFRSLSGFHLRLLSSSYYSRRFVICFILDLRLNDTTHLRPYPKFSFTKPAQSTKHLFSFIAFLYPYATFTFPSYSLADLVCFHVHPRFCLTSFETSIIIMIASYPTPLYFHSTHSWYIGLLHRSSFAFLGFPCDFSFILHSR